ncbi:3-oxoadipate CoA-transferase subunit B [Klebsiella pneumoniae]|nr:3-oxoadipate CoA-transferase subunit B [Klebsiella pneumoniae]
MQKLTRDEMAQRVACDIPEGAYVNLGIGLPTRIANYLPADKEVFLHSENGLLGMGPKPQPGEEDPELINAGKEYVTLLQGGCYFHHGDSFAMMRGGHLDICVLGAYQVSASGDLANWSTGAQAQKEGLRNVLIVHGKGRDDQSHANIIRSYLARWLEELPEVQAFCAALPHHGGSGACYVALRKSAQAKQETWEQHAKRSR